MNTLHGVKMTEQSSADAFASAQTPITFIDFLLDETGSMGSCAGATRAGFNGFVKEQREAGLPCYLTLAKFDSSSVRVPYENLDIGMVPPLDFYPNASTNLYDCIGERLTRVMEQERQGKSLFIILTDGGDNASRSYNIDTARGVIEQAQASGVVVVYMGPSSNAYAIGEKLGVPQGNIFPFETAHMEETMQTLAASTRAFTAGSTISSDNFFA